MIKYLDLKRVNDTYDEEIRRSIDEVLRSGWYLKGEATHRFEQHYADFIGTQYCIGCGNGLDALTLILRAYKEMGKLHDGDEIIVPANTYIASILAITENGLTPVLIEPSLQTLHIDDALIENAVTSRTRAVMIVHLYGRCAFTHRIGEICEKHQLLLIEDNAQAHGCTFEGRRTGSLGNAAGHSFYPGKNLGALGDAGAVTTDDEELALLVASLGNYGSSRKYVFEYVGRNSRLDELQAAVLDVKLRHLDEDNNRRKAIAEQYINKVENPRIKMPQSVRDSVFHIFPVLCEHRDELQQYLKTHGVETQIHYPIPPHRQRCYQQWHHLSLPVTEMIHEQELSLPCNQVMTGEEVEYIIGLLQQF